MQSNLILYRRRCVFVDEITLHIRNVGKWTGQLYRMVQQLQAAKSRDGKINWAFKNHFSTDIDIGIDIDIGMNLINLKVITAFHTFTTLSLNCNPLRRFIYRCI